MQLNALGYIGIRSARLDDWNSYATGLLGMQRVDPPGRCAPSAWTTGAAPDGHR